MYQILMVEDDPVIASSVAAHLEAWGFRVRCVENFRDVMQDFTAFSPELVLMDITLPFFSGYHWCAEIRKISKVPVMFVSSAGDNLNIVMAINMGGDDFIAKPFDLSVLTAKVNALLRRTYSFGAALHLMEHRGVVLNLNDATLTYAGKKLELTKNDFKMLQILLEQAGKIVTREEMMLRLWESDQFVDDNTLTVNMTRLRKKLAELCLADFVVTKKGIGYLVEA